MHRKAILVYLLLATPSVLADSTPRVDRMEANQRARIEHGVQAGQLTVPETRRLVHQERQLARHEAHVKSDGVVTWGERYRLNRDALRTGRAIHRQAHDGQTRH